METSIKKPDMHLGRKVGRMRELLGIKQETLAAELGISQQAVSKLEQSEKIDDEKLEQVAKVLGIKSEAIRNFNEEAALSIISNTFNSNDSSTLNAINYYPTFNPYDKIVELYEALLRSEREKVAMLERLLEKKS